MRKNRLMAEPAPEPEIFTDEAKKASLRVESGDAFFKRIGEKIKNLKRAKPLPAEVTLSFESPERLLEVLTPKRYELYKSVRDHGMFDSIEAVATLVHRDRSTVSRDLQELAAIGLVAIDSVPHPGHGSRSSVSAVAKDVYVKLAL